MVTGYIKKDIGLSQVLKEEMIKAAKKHLEENEYCTIAITRKGYEIKSSISIMRVTLKLLQHKKGQLAK